MLKDLDKKILDRKIKENDERVLYVLNNPHSVIHPFKLLDEKLEEDNEQVRQIDNLLKKHKNELIKVIKEAIKSSWQEEKETYLPDIEDLSITINNLINLLTIISANKNDDINQKKSILIKNRTEIMNIIKDQIKKIEEENIFIESNIKNEYVEDCKSETIETINIHEEKTSILKPNKFKKIKTSREKSIIDKNEIVA